MRDLLEAVFVSEMVCPSARIVVVSAYVSDAPIIDNRSGQFANLEPQWPLAWVRLSQVLRSTLQRGAELHIASRPGAREDDFMRQLVSRSEFDGTDSLIVTHEYETAELAERSHEKAIIADTWALHGSMNFTYSGIELNGELVTFETDPSAIGELSAEFASIFQRMP